MTPCPAFEPVGQNIVQLAAFAECHAALLGEEGYRALSGGTPMGMVLTGLLTIFVAVTGLRMATGDTPAIRDMVMMAAKMGIVLALATQWSAYRPLVYDLAMRGPMELGARIGGAVGMEVDTSDRLLAHLQDTHDRIQAIVAPPGRGTDTAPGPGPASPANGAAPMPTGQKEAPQVGLGDARLQQASTVLIVTGLGGLMAARLATGLLLALGPPFLAMLLFDRTRSLFAGWIRALLGASLAVLPLALILAMELTVVDAQLRAIREAGRYGAAALSLPGDILVNVLVFTLVLVVATGAVVRAAATFRLPPVRQWTGAAGTAAMPSSGAAFAAQPALPAHGAAGAAVLPRPRARQQADAIAALVRRSERAAAARPAETGTIHRWTVAAPIERGAAAIPIGQTQRRPAQPRQSTSSKRRDARS